MPLLSIRRTNACSKGNTWPPGGPNSWLFCLLFDTQNYEMAHRAHPLIFRYPVDSMTTSLENENLKATNAPAEMMRRRLDRRNAKKKQNRNWPKKSFQFHHVVEFAICFVVVVVFLPFLSVATRILFISEFVNCELTRTRTRMQFVSHSQFTKYVRHMMMIVITRAEQQPRSIVVGSGSGLESLSKHIASHHSLIFIPFHWHSCSTTSAVLRLAVCELFASICSLQLFGSRVRLSLSLHSFFDAKSVWIPIFFFSQLFKWNVVFYFLFHHLYTYFSFFPLFATSFDVLAWLRFGARLLVFIFIYFSSNK